MQRHVKDQVEGICVMLFNVFVPGLQVEGRESSSSSARLVVSRYRPAALL